MAGNVRLGGSEFLVDETAGEVLIPIERVDDLSGRVEVEYLTTEDSASSSADYTDVSGTVVFEDGETLKYVSVPIVDDSLPEGSEDFVFRLLSADNAFLQFPRTATVVINDDEAPSAGGGDGNAAEDFTVSGSTYISGLDEPIAFQWLPGQPETLFIAEKPGVIRVFQDGVLLDEPFIDLSAEINERQDRGLLDIELHPDFPNTPYVYLYYVVDPPDTALYDPSSPAGPDGTGNRFAQLVRFTADVDAGYLKAVPDSKVVLVGGAGQSLDDISGGGLIDSTTDFGQPASGIDPVTGENIDDYIVVDSRSHSGGDISFGPDGALYLSTGDGASFNGVDPRGVRVQDPDNLAGKILRIDPITGEGLPDNPFFVADDPNDNLSKVYQLGLRNPFRTAFDDNGKLFIGDVGWNQWEEIDNAGPGANFGWPFFEGGSGGVSLQTPSYRDLPEAQAFYASGQTVEAPFLAFQHPQVQALILGDIYGGSVYPGFLRNDVFFVDVSNGGLYAVDVRNAGETVKTLSDSVGAGIVYMSEGPDGLMYYADLFAGVIGRWNIVVSDRTPQSFLDFGYDGFNDSSDFFNNGSAAHVGTTLQLTSAAQFQAGSTYFKDPLKVAPDTSFSTAFSFTMSGGQGTAGADGLTFVMQNDAAGVTALGDSGNSLGLANYDPSQGSTAKIGNSLAITFDTVRSPWQAAANEVDIVVDGDLKTPLLISHAGFDLNGTSAPRYAWIDYNGQDDLLEVYLSRNDVKPASPLLTETIDLAGIVGDKMYMGFTGGTGVATNVQAIESWRFTGGVVLPMALSFDYDDFSDPAALKWNGNAAPVTGVLELTPAQPNQAGSVFYGESFGVSGETSFSTAFSFKMNGGDGPKGADGLTFVIHGDPAGSAALGDPGGSLGLDNLAAFLGGTEKIDNSLAITFDTFRNTWQADANQIDIVTDGNVKTPIASGNAGFDLNGSDAARYVWIDYDGPRDHLDVFLAETGTKPATPVVSATVDLAAIVGDEAFVGFTGATGGKTNDQSIENWHFSAEVTVPATASFAYDDFTDTSRLAWNGSAAPVADVLELTPAEQQQAGSAFHTEGLGISGETSFSTAFSFKMSGGNGTAGADGLAFVIQGDPAGTAALGDPGASLGLDNLAPSYGGTAKIGESLAITFDTYRNSWQAAANQIAVVVDGNVKTPVAEGNAGFDLNGSDAPRFVWIDYDGTSDRLDVFLAQADTKPATPVVSATVDLAAIVGDEAFVGFTAATGGMTNVHEIVDWTFDSDALLV